MIEILKSVFEGALYLLGICFISYIIYCMIRAFVKIFGDDNA